MEDQNKKNQEIINKLSSSNENEIIETIKLLRKVGNNVLLYQTFITFQNNSSQQIKDEIFRLWCDLQLQESVDVIIDVIEKNEFADIKREVISSCWQSKLEFKDLVPFINTVINDDFETAIEAFTVIDNNAFQVSKANLTEHIQQLKSAFATISEDKKELVKQIIVMLEDAL